MNYVQYFPTILPYPPIPYLIPIRNNIIIWLDFSQLRHPRRICAQISKSHDDKYAIFLPGTKASKPQACMKEKAPPIYSEMWVKQR